MSHPDKKTSDPRKRKEEKKALKGKRKAARSKAKSHAGAGMLRQMMGGSSNADRSKKAHEEKVAGQKRARAAARDISSFIGYDAIYRDGIAQVEEGLFSQTVEFADISYQSARKESQQNIFTVLSSLYNYFGADSSVQLTIANVPIPDEEIGVSATAKSAERATLSRRRRPRFPAGGATALWPPALEVEIWAADFDYPAVERALGGGPRSRGRPKCGSAPGREPGAPPAGSSGAFG